MIGHAGSMMHTALDANGSVQLRRRPPGRYEVRLWCQGFAPVCVRIDLTPGEILERTIEVVRGFQVSGRCVDEQGRPIAGQFSLSPLPLAGELPEHLEDSSSVIHTGRTDGTFELQLGPGRWLLQPTEKHEGSRRDLPRLGHNVAVDVRSGPVTDLVVVLHPTTSAIVS